MDSMQVLSRFFTADDFRDLNTLFDHDWTTLTQMNDILEVSSIACNLGFTVLTCLMQVGHCFQQALSAEKTLTLGHALPAFEAMYNDWLVLSDKYPHLSDAIDAGLDKLSDYIHRVRQIPAYTLAMGRLLAFFTFC